MNKSEATKAVIKEFLKRETQLSQDDLVLIFAVLNKYGIEIITAFDNSVKRLMSPTDEIQEVVNEITKL